jgi:FAD synthase
MIGVWDPFLPEHESILRELVAAAWASARSPVVLLLDPPPPALMRGTGRWPVHLAPEARVELLLETGLEAVAVVRMTRADLDAGAAELLAQLEPVLTLSELWLGARQRLGSLDAGAPETVDRLLMERGIGVRRLPDSDVPAIADEVRYQLSLGRPAAAANLAGRRAVLARPPGGMIRSAWPAGVYQGWAVDDLSSAATPGEGITTIEFHLDPEPSGGRQGSWPGSSQWLIVAAGPGDAAAIG